MTARRTVRIHIRTPKSCVLVERREVVYADAVEVEGGNVDGVVVRVVRNELVSVPPAVRTFGAAYDVMAGPTVSIVTFTGALGTDSFPAASRATTVNGSDPSASADVGWKVLNVW